MDDAVKNAALQISLEWGPRRLIPLEQRLAEARPELTPEQISELQGLCGRVESDAWGTVASSFAAHAGNENVANTAWTKALREKYPWLDSKNFGSLWTQGCYYAWKDGELT